MPSDEQRERDGFGVNDVVLGVLTVLAGRLA